MQILFRSQLPTPDELSSTVWDDAEPVVVTTYWSGEEAPLGRHFEARSLWSDSGMAIRFVANQAEPLIINPDPHLSSKTVELWDRDVCEIFIAPHPEQPRRYFEFEIAPTGEWIDLGVHQLPDRRETDWEYASGMSAFGKIEGGRVLMSALIPWTAFGKTPKNGEVWKGNLLRCVGSGDTRGYLAWKPTKTAEPNFHVPEVFGDLHFVG